MKAADNFTCIVLSLLAAGCLAGCASTQAPRGYLLSASDVEQTSYGAWAIVRPVTDETSGWEGELIAVYPDSLFVLSTERLLVVPRDEVSEVTLNLYRTRHGTFAAWTILGALSTGSHGIGLIISAPVWIIWGSITTAAVSREPILKCSLRRSQRASSGTHGVGWDDLSKFARFPQGLPEIMNRASLKPR